VKIERPLSEMLVITGAPNLDSIGVVFRDVGPGQGGLTIECYGKAWSAGWGGMGNKTVRQFVASCDADYLASRLWNSDVKRTKQSFDYLLRICSVVIKTAREELTQEQAREVSILELAKPQDVPNIVLELIIRLLNEANAADPKAIAELCSHRVLCNEDLAKHPTVQVTMTKDNEVVVGMLGVINGMTERLTGRRVMACFAPNGSIERFDIHNPTQGASS